MPKALQHIIQEARMKPKGLRYCLLMGFVISMLWVGLIPVRAEGEVVKEEACISCHKNLYVLYDTGKWHCLSESRPAGRCHGQLPVAAKYHRVQ